MINCQMKVFRQNCSKGPEKKKKVRSFQDWRNPRRLHVNWLLQGEQDRNRQRGHEREFQQKSKFKEAAPLTRDMGSPEYLKVA